MERCNCAASWANVPCRCPWRRPPCARYKCGSYGIWEDVETGEVYCGAHAVLFMDGDTADVKEKRADFAREYARDAAREARRS